MERGFRQPRDVKDRLGYHAGQIGSGAPRDADGVHR